MARRMPARVPRIARCRSSPAGPFATRWSPGLTRCTRGRERARRERARRRAESSDFATTAPQNGGATFSVRAEKGEGGCFRVRIKPRRQRPGGRFCPKSGQTPSPFSSPLRETPSAFCSPLSESPSPKRRAGVRSRRPAAGQTPRACVRARAEPPERWLRECP